MPRVKIGIRIPSLKKRIAARRSGWPGGKRFWRHSVGLKAPRGMGWVTNPKKFVYNKIYRRTTRGISGSFVGLLIVLCVLAVFADAIAKIVATLLFVLAVAAGAMIAGVGALLVLALIFPQMREPVLDLRNAVLRGLGSAFNRKRRRKRH